MAFTDYGVKTGDFLSPFLFILCTEELISFPRGSEEQTYFVTSYCESKPEGISYFICWLHHLFCQAWVSQCIEIVNILDTYGKTPEQRLDAIKSSLVFGNKMVQEKKRKMKGVFGISSKEGLGMYLGLPEQICGLHVKIFSFVHDWMNGRVNWWSTRFLTNG